MTALAAPTSDAPSPARVLTSPALYAQTFLRVLNKSKQLVPLVYNRAQRDYLSRRTGRDLILKARQMGFSTMLQAELFRKATTSTCTTLTLTHVDATTQALRRMSDRFYDNIPAPFPKPLRTYANAAVTTYADTESECLIATAGSRGVGRGVTGSDMHLSEVAFWPDADTVMVGLLQSVPANGSIVVESTPNGQSGWFYDRCMEALRGEGEWTLHFYAWWWDDDYRTPLDVGEVITYTDEEQALVTAHGLTPEQIKWRRKKQKELKEKFPQEYPEDSLSCFVSMNGATVFSHVRDRATAPVYADRAAYLKEYPNARFSIGVDWGRDNDWSVFTVIDVTRATVVAVERYRWIPYPLQMSHLKTLWQAWQAERVLVESNSIGATNFDQLVLMGLPAQPFNTSESSKKMIIDRLSLALEEGHITLLKPADTRTTDTPDTAELMIRELLGYQIKKNPSGSYSYEGKPHDDCVMSLAIAYYAINQGVPGRW